MMQADPNDKCAESFKAWVSDLACPACQASLRFDGAHVICASCGRTYPVVDGIPVLIAERGETSS